VRANVLNWTVALLVVAAAIAFSPLWAPLLLAAWCACVAAPLYQRIRNRVRQKNRAAGLLTVLLVLAFLIPFLLMGLSLSASAIDLAHRLQQSKTGADALHALAAGDSGLKLDGPHIKQLLELAQRHAASALGAARVLFGAATTAIIGLVVFVGGFYTFLVDGKRLYNWLLERSPLSLEHSLRFGAVFVEAGRGLLIGVGLTALLQGAAATVGYFVVGVPQALVLGLVTVFASLIPSVGAALVWAPVTAGLAISGRTGAAVVMLVIGCFVSVVDNIVRPFLSRFGKLELPGFALFVSMLGGIAAFGTWGLLLGPFFVRMASEGLTLFRNQRLVDAVRAR
jgi:predicted PurR-regulated permease PerM